MVIFLTYAQKTEWAVAQKLKYSEQSDERHSSRVQIAPFKATTTMKIQVNLSTSTGEKKITTCPYLKSTFECGNTVFVLLMTSDLQMIFIVTHAHLTSSARSISAVTMGCLCTFHISSHVKHRFEASQIKTNWQLVTFFFNKMHLSTCQMCMNKDSIWLIDTGFNNRSNRSGVRSRRRWRSVKVLLVLH